MAKNLKVLLEKVDNVWNERETGRERDGETERERQRVPK